MDYVKSVQEMFYKERIGTVYGCFEVIDVRYDESEKRQVWTMRCIYCGAEKETRNGKDYVKGKNHGICKCMHTKKAPLKKPQKIKKALMKDCELYSRWNGMKSRCYSRKDKDYPNYGGRGIKMCSEWKDDFWSFEKWSRENGYSKELTIDRIDVNGDYCPGNCRWISRADQNRNKRSTIKYDGKLLSEYCEKNGLRYSYILSRIKKGDTVEEAKSRAEEREFSEECRKYGKDPKIVRGKMEKGMSFEDAVSEKYGWYRIGDEYKPLEEWCRQYGITSQAVLYRIRNGMTVEDAIKRPKAPGVKIKV